MSMQDASDGTIMHHDTHSERERARARVSYRASEQASERESESESESESERERERERERLDLFEKVALLTEAAAVLVHHLHVFMCMQRHHIEHVHESVHAVQYNVQCVQCVH